jgi:hypothetical protein
MPSGQSSESMQLQARTTWWQRGPFGLPAQSSSFSHWQ